jgi:hypothetical protein
VTHSENCPVWAYQLCDGVGRIGGGRSGASRTTVGTVENVHCGDDSGARDELLIDPAEERVLKSQIRGDIGDQEPDDYERHDADEKSPPKGQVHGLGARRT